MQETGPTVYSAYPRRPERLAICRYDYKGSKFSFVVLWLPDHSCKQVCTGIDAVVEDSEVTGEDWNIQVYSLSETNAG